MSPSGGLGLASAGPSLGKAPAAGFGGPLKGGLRRSVSVGIEVKQEWNESSTWKVCDLEQVPADFPLERTHREIYDTDAAEVAGRISKALRLLSVDAVYDGPKGKAKCTTSDMVSFRIRLYSGGEPGEGLPVVVEVQRRGGSATSFMSVCRKILDGAEGAEIQAATEPSRKKMPPFLKGSISSMKCLQSAGPKPDAESLSKSELNKSTDLLRSKNKDSNLLGLENLCLLTDPLKTRMDVALRACKAILLDSPGAEIREELGVLLQKDAFLPEDFDEEATRTIVEKSRHFALILVSNSLLLTSKDGCLAEALKSQKWFGEFLVPSLLDEVKGCAFSANNAYEATCGLTSLAKCSDMAQRLMKENSAVEDLRAAHNFGVHNHELLANEAERCLAELGSSA
jgi:hypothetical protein